VSSKNSIASSTNSWKFVPILDLKKLKLTKPKEEEQSPLKQQPASKLSGHPSHINTMTQSKISQGSEMMSPPQSDMSKFVSET